MWRNRNCLMKLCLNSKQTELFKGLSADVFREIIKYAWKIISLTLYINYRNIKDLTKSFHSFLSSNSSSYNASMIPRNSCEDLSRSLLRIRCLNMCHSSMHSPISPVEFSKRFAITSGLSVFLFNRREWSSDIEGGHTNIKLVSGKMAWIFLAPWMSMSNRAISFCFLNSSICAFSEP